MARIIWQNENQNETLAFYGRNRSFCHTIRAYVPPPRLGPRTGWTAHLHLHTTQLQSQKLQGVGKKNTKKNTSTNPQIAQMRKHFAKGVAPSYVNEGEQPMYEYIFACGGTVTSRTAPEFMITVKNVAANLHGSANSATLGAAGAQNNLNNKNTNMDVEGASPGTSGTSADLQEDPDAPAVFPGVELYCSVCQTDSRLTQTGAGRRRQHIPILLKCYEQVSPVGRRRGTDGVTMLPEYAYVTKSNWLQNARDSTLAWKSMGHGATYKVTTEWSAGLAEKDDLDMQLEKLDLAQACMELHNRMFCLKRLYTPMKSLVLRCGLFV